MKKKGNILTENIVFIILNLVFFAILILFLFSKIGNASVLEENYAKQIALIIDSAEPYMEINLNMEDAIEKADDEGFSEKGIVTIQDNIVTVKLREKGGYSYSFFNDVEVNSYPDTQGGYIFIIDEK